MFAETIYVRVWREGRLDADVLRLKDDGVALGGG